MPCADMRRRLPFVYPLNFNLLYPDRLLISSGQATLSEARSSTAMAQEAEQHRRKMPPVCGGAGCFESVNTGGGGVS